MGRSDRTTATIESLLESGAITTHKDGNFGALYPKANEFGSEGVPFLTAKSLRDGKIDIDNAPRLVDERADKLRFGFIEPGDVLLSHNATIGRVAIVPNFTGRLLVGTSLTYFRVNPQKLSARYLAAYFAGRDFQNQLASVMSFTTRNQVPITLQRRLSVVVPPLQEQETIAGMLGALDDKIELNRRMNETLEALAQSLFKSWFVDATQSALPKGWREVPFTETVEIIGGGTPKTSVAEYWGGDIRWFSVVDAPQGSDLFVIDTEKKITQAGVDNSSTQVLPVGTTIISARGTVGKVALVGVPMAMNQSCYGLRGKAGKQGFHTYFVTRALVSQLQQHAHGSVFDTITRDTLAGVQVALPPAAVVEQFEETVSPLMEHIRNNLHESRTLAALRDALLPKLLSGELRVPTDDQAKEATL